MSADNVKRLKNLLGLPSTDIEVEKYLNLIDKVYYEGLVYCEEEKKENNSTLFVFEDDTRIEMNFQEMCRYLLIVDILEDSEEMFI